MPDINIVSPNGGEVWQAGTTQTVTVNVTGDPTKVTTSGVALYLENSNGNGDLSNGYSLGGGSINGTTGLKSFQVVLPTNYLGQDKIYATLQTSLPAGTTCPAGYVGCVPEPVLQAYDYSDNYFTVMSPTNYPYPTTTYTNPSQCPAGYSSSGDPNLNHTVLPICSSTSIRAERRGFNI